MMSQAWAMAAMKVRPVLARTRASTSGAARKGLTVAAGGWSSEYSVPREETSGDSVDGWVEGEWRRAGHQWWWPLVLAQTSSSVARVWGGGSFCLSDGSGEERKRGLALGERMGIGGGQMEVERWGAVRRPSPLPSAWG